VVFSEKFHAIWLQFWKGFDFLSPVFFFKTKVTIIYFINLFSFYIKPGTVMVTVVQKHTGLKTKLY